MDPPRVEKGARRGIRPVVTLEQREHVGGAEEWRFQMRPGPRERLNNGDVNRPSQDGGGTLTLSA